MTLLMKITSLREQKLHEIRENYVIYSKSLLEQPNQDVIHAN